MKPIFAATLFTATLGLSACDATPLASPPVVATAAAEEETPEELLAEMRRQHQQMCANILNLAQVAYQARRNGTDRQALLGPIANRKMDFGPAAEPVRELVKMIYEAPPAQFWSPEMPEVLPVLATITCQRVTQTILANLLDQP